MSETSSSFRDKEELIEIKQQIETELHEVTSQFITIQNSYKEQLQVASQLDQELCTLRSNLLVSGAIVLYEYGSAPKRNPIGLKGTRISDTQQKKQLVYEIRQVCGHCFPHIKLEPFLAVFHRFQFTPKR